MSFFDEHGGSCAPINPCTNCRSISFLRQNLGEEKFDAFLVILGELVPTEPSLLDRFVAQLEIGQRAKTALVGEDITNIDKLIQKSPSDLLQIDGFGDTSLKEVEKALRSIGLRLRHESE